MTTDASGVAKLSKTSFSGLNGDKSGQANKFYVFPAIGMADFATQASGVTDEMFIESAHAVADEVPSELLKQGLLFPLQSNILEAEI